jgi:hypothetical protein
MEDVYEMEDKKDFIVSHLHGLIEQLESSNGDMQSAKATDDYSTLEYVHLVNKPLDTLFID